MFTGHLDAQDKTISLTNVDERVYKAAESLEGLYTKAAEVYTEWSIPELHVKLETPVYYEASELEIVGGVSYVRETLTLVPEETIKYTTQEEVDEENAKHLVDYVKPAEYYSQAEIDAAKAMWIKYEYPEVTFEDMCKVFGLPHLRTKAHFCAVSSTSGTATEVTAFSIITDYQKGIKFPIADFEITPDVAIVDPELAETMPKKLVAHTGMDAMTHAVEAYVSTANSDYTDPLAIHAIEMIMKDLVPSYNGDMDARDRMHNAQCLAGMSFSNALLGIVHSMAHKTGAAFADFGAHIIHGAANAMYLPKVIAFNANDEAAKKRYGVIVDYMGIASKNASDDDKVAALIAYLRKMNDDLNIPHCIKNYGADSYPAENGFVPEEVFLERLHDIAVNAIADACTGSNPRQPSVEEMEKLLKCCYYDTEVDF